VINQRNEAAALRLLLSFLEADTDAVTRILEEIDSDSGAIDVALVLARLLSYEIGGGNNRAAWLEYITSRLVGPLPGVPDAIDFDT
jgi:hypothetical protein